jgi:hypothetical protein
MATRILVYGGTNLTPALVRFVGRLTRRLLVFDDVVLLSGGFEGYKHHPNRVSVDKTVLTEAERSIVPARFDRRFETWLPRESLDRRSVRRFKRGALHELTGTAQARRFALVKAADALVTIEGEGNTRTVLEFALALGKPALPVPFSGGDSRRIWNRHRDDLLGPLRLRPALVRRLEGGPRLGRGLDRLAADVAAAICEAAQKRCLVLMPFGRGHDGFYAQVLHPAIKAAGHLPYRIDREEYSGNIPSLFLAALGRARGVVVDVTGSNPNVMYELGQVHARGISPLLVLRRRLTRAAYAALPFYLHHEMLVAAPDNPSGHRRIGREIGSYLARLAQNSDEGRRG